MQPQTSVSPTPRVRNVKFTELEPSGHIPRYWHGGRRSVTAFFDGLSVFFPVGERFFVRSVRAFDRRVADGPMRDAVRAFCGQEGIHGREHERYNAHLAALGLPVAAMEARVARILERVTRSVPPRAQLAATCALEHFTALLGERVLSESALFEGADPTMAALWRWHAAEEVEHKAVAFDVFLAAGGTYRERVLAMAVASVIFCAKVFEHQIRMMAADGIAWSPREWAALVRFLFVEPGHLASQWPRYAAYYRRGFHPNDVDSTAVLAQWSRDRVQEAATAAWTKGRSPRAGGDRARQAAT